MKLDGIDHARLKIGDNSKVAKIGNVLWLNRRPRKSRLRMLQIETLSVE